MINNDFDNLTIIEHEYYAFKTNRIVNNQLYTFFNNDLINFAKIFVNSHNYFILKLPGTHINFYLDSYYKNLCLLNTASINFCVTIANNKIQFLNIFSFLQKFFKITLFFMIVYIVFFMTNLDSYTKKLIEVNNLAKFFILNETEKEFGPLEDLYFFIILFMVLILSFVFSSMFFFLMQGKFFIWTFIALLLVMILILSVPLNLFWDYGINFFVYIRGSASGGNFIKELLFDVISAFTILIRFIIQNIRFLFIFFAVFELLEWVFTINSNIFFFFDINSKNYLINLTTISNIWNTKNTNLLILNLFLFIIFYFYYTLHLLFLLLVQIIIYIGISSWLFFFLYSTRFLTKREKSFFSLKK